MSSTRDAFLLFYAGKLHSKYDHFPLCREMSAELYNGGVVHIADARTASYYNNSNGWHRADGTPILIQEVPLELRALAILLT